MDATAPPELFEHEQILSILAGADADRIKSFGQRVIGKLSDIEVLKSRTGLVMLPMRDTAQGMAFHLGEVLVSEAHVRTENFEGYGMRRGRDLEATMAMAVIDLAISMNIAVQDCIKFLHEEEEHQQQVDELTLRKIEATRVDMETF